MWISEDLNPHPSWGGVRSIPIPKQENLFTSSLLCSMRMLDVSVSHWFVHVVPLTVKTRLLNNIIGLILVFWLQERFLPLPDSCLSSYWFSRWKGFIWCCVQVGIKIPWAESFAFYLFGIYKVFHEHCGWFVPLFLLAALAMNAAEVRKAFLLPGKDQKRGGS